jgi:DNA-directed RNA polymerase subunit K/omega
MTDIKSKVQGIDANISARDIQAFSKKSGGNIYEALVIIHKRANQLSSSIKQELHQKLDEFALTTETIEEIHENKEQIEISKFYERMPNPAVIAIHEYMNDELSVRDKNKELHEEEEVQDNE